VDIVDDGRAEDRDGGVVGTYLVLGIAAAAGEGDVARYSRRSAPSFIRRGGVFGGLEWKDG